MTNLALLSDVHGIRHALDCRRSERIYRDRDGAWCCNGCGRRAHQPLAPTGAEATKKENK